MTDRLTQIRERFDAIIPGPWRWYGNTSTNQVALATTDRGRLFILDTHTRTTQYVWDPEELENYPLEQARERVIHWCGSHGEDSDPATREKDCICDALRDFLRGEIELDEGTRRFQGDGNPFLVRGVQVHPDLRFPDRSLGDRRPQHGGMMQSYRGQVRYEVLGRRTTAEWVMDQGGVIPSAGHDIKDALYREDFCGIDNPEATFIEHGPEDIDYLLKRVGAAEVLVEALAEALVWTNRGQQLQGTDDALLAVAQARLRWEELVGL